MNFCGYNMDGGEVRKPDEVKKTVEIHQLVDRVTEDSSTGNE